MNSQKFPMSLLTIALYGAMSSAWGQAASANAAAAQETESASQKTAGTTDDTHSLDSIQVTGSRLQHGDVTSRVIIINQEEIKSRGVTSVEELIRTLPQNLATIGDITNERSRGPLGSASRGNAAPSAIGTLGVSAANLGGMGAGNTLILINGRRVAGAAGIEDGFVNLNGIPLSAVDRVEINLDGSSAVYGSDAIGGVINFILKKNFIGNTVSVQHEYSSNDADNSRISLYSGYAWGSGSLSATIDHGERKPINNWKSGYTTNDYSGYYNGDPNYDKRSLTTGLQPGVIYTPEYTANGTIQKGLTVPAGFTGVPTVGDFVEVGSEAIRDVVPELAGADSKSNSVTLHFEQEITDKLRITADGLYSRTRNSQEQTYNNGQLNLALAPGQYYNPFPASYFGSWQPYTQVYYYPGDEIASGELPPGTIKNTSTSWNANVGLSYQFTPETKLELLYTTSASKTEGNSMHFGSVVNSIIADPTSPSGYSCYNFFLASNRYSGRQQQQLQQAFDRQCAALTSTDPNLAFNPWKSTANGGGSSISDFYYELDDEQRSSRTENWELRLNGSLYELPAGKIYYVVGGEYYDDGVDSEEVRNYTGESVSRDRHAYFAEATIPVFGQDFTLPGVQALTLNAAVRRDSYETEGAIGTVDGIPTDLGGQLIYGKNTFSRNTPSFGFRWDVAGGLALRGRWTRGFEVPPFTNLFSVSGTTSFSTAVFDDPLYDCSTSVQGCDYPYSSNAYYALRSTAPNPDLKPQTSTQRSFGLSWYPQGALQGLTLDVNYSHTKINNEYADLDDLLSLLPVQTVYQLEQFYPRDETGRVIGIQNMIFNISGSEYASITYELGYRFDTPLGGFEPRLTYLDNLKSEKRAFADSTPLSTLGHIQGVDEYKVIGQLRWYYRNLTATLWANYIPKYLNDYELNTSAGVVRNPDYAKPVGSFLTYDLSLSWQMRNDLRLNFAGRNILDKDPRFVVVESRPYDTARYNAAGRTLSLELQYDF